MLFFRQPSSRAYTLPVVRSLTGWYYTRLLITVTPRSVTERPAGSVALPAARLRRARPSSRSWRRAVEAGLTGARELSGYPSCVFAARDVDGGIALARTAAQPADRGYAVAAAPGADLAEGPASVLVHRHDEKLAGLRFAVIRGRITRATAGDWLLVPDRVISPAGAPLQTLRDCRASAARYLAARELARPAVPWQQYRALARRPADRTRGLPQRPPCRLGRGAQWRFTVTAAATRTGRRSRPHAIPNRWSASVTGPRTPGCR